MGGSFACPECGQGISVTGLTPGREVICPGCSTLIEVPYLPRATRTPRRRDLRPGGFRGGRRSGRGRMTLATRRHLRWGLALGSVLAVIMATWWAVGSIGAKGRSDRERVLHELIAASDAAGAVGDPGAAFREIEAAVVQARKIDPDGSSRLDALIARRDQAARAEVQARLAGIDRLAGDRAVGEAEILADRVRKDPALAALADAVAARVEATTKRQAEVSRDLARTALAEGRAVEAFRAASRAHDRADRLAAKADADRIRAEVRAVIVEAVERFGVASATPIPTVPDPSAPDVVAFVGPIWAEALAARGYLLPPAGSTWAEVWTAHAPYQATLKLDETRNELYLQSQNRSTQINGAFSLTVHGVPHWQTQVFAQTRAPIPDLPAYIAGRLATADRRDPETERRLRDDARTAFRIQLDRVFRGIRPPTAAPATATSSRSS